MTSLGDGKRVSKNSPHIKTIGLLDELNARLGHASLETQSGNIFDSLRLAQNDVFDLSGELSLASKAKPIFQKDRILEIESEIKKMNLSLPPLKEFILPGADELSARIHLARTACRTAELSLFALEEDLNFRECLGIYLNRLSDYLFVMARFHVTGNKLKEAEWKHQK